VSQGGNKCLGDDCLGAWLKKVSKHCSGYTSSVPNIPQQLYSISSKLEFD